MGHSYDGWNSGPKLDEARILAPEVPGHRARKDRRRWCRGKVGIEHVTTLVMSKWALYFKAKNDGDRYPQHWRCGWFEKGRWCHIEGQRLREFVGNGQWYYSCHHVHTCTSCGKILRDATSRECPDYAPHGSPSGAAT